jgi:hypothetical protein
MMGDRRSESASVRQNSRQLEGRGRRPENRGRIVHLQPSVKSVVKTSGLLRLLRFFAATFLGLNDRCRVMPPDRAQLTTG